MNCPPTGLSALPAIGCPAALAALQDVVQLSERCQAALGTELAALREGCHRARLLYLNLNQKTTTAATQPREWQLQLSELRGACTALDHRLRQAREQWQQVEAAAAVCERAQAQGLPHGLEELHQHTTRLRAVQAKAAVAQGVWDQSSDTLF
ncbi:hypothetical protein HaLaN_12445, partial [Haematococcus lacustris]